MPPRPAWSLPWRIDLSGSFHQSADRTVDPADVSCLPGRLHATEAGVADLHFRGSFSWSYAGSFGVDSGACHLEWGTLILFAILFVWQFPHFFSIAWLYREDYAAGGIRMLPVVEQDGRSTARRILIYSLILIPLSTLPVFSVWRERSIWWERDSRDCAFLVRRASRVS